MKFWSPAIKLNELESESDKMKGEEDSLENFPIDTSLKTIAHSVLQVRSYLIFVSYASHDVSVKISSEGNFVILKAKGNPM